MLYILMMALLLSLISYLVMTIASLLSFKSIYDQEKNSPFECGFDPFSSSRLPFSLHFFLIAIIFLIFDIEIALLLPMILIYSSSIKFYWLITSIIFIIILLIGLYYEWYQGMLNWS
uniref:NADH-ubiquinone oxidoreductase chain 3 n=1 Tax=Paradoxopsyllus custodis TaxID=3040964 RepID=A0AA95FLD0_9NEOP|nr:NADH dehydrogenase subunit 3 [Paradoxopsyllus custodis]YP_011004243.1 NADH dehydrogenase subunit 3 [Macrostylophora euteles]WGC90509.1 NADH dehydrogenase subunit 3 [Paradoxopsyllus custodis]WPS93592.1 NADH dehydrogenase subunit 3 [Macrostylophora euteles]